MPDAVPDLVLAELRSRIARLEQGQAQDRAALPFGVPFAILLDVATRAGRLLPADEAERRTAICWLFAALNSLEPPLSNLAEVDFFIEDEDLKARRRPGVVAAADLRLGQVSRALGSLDYLVGNDFTVADMMTSSVLRVSEHTDPLDDYPNPAPYRDRCFARPACRKAVADQRADIEANSAQNMHYDAKVDA